MITRAEFISTAVDCGYATREKAERYAGDLRAADREIEASPDKYKTVKQPKVKPDKPKRTDTTPTVTAYCKGCIYLYKSPRCCIYASEHGSRPCPVGDGCIVRKTKGKGETIRVHDFRGDSGGI